MNMDGFSSSVGMKVYGLLRMGLLRPFKFTIDNARKVLVLRVDNTFEPPNSLKIHFKETAPNSILIPLNINGKVYTTQVDTGLLGSQLSLPDSCIADTNVFESDICSLDPDSPKGQAAVSSFSIMHIVRLRNIKMGPLKISSLLATTFKTAVPLLGQEFLRHFNITIDYYNDTVQFELNKNQTIPNNIYSFGFFFNKEENGLRVISI